jgi:hypothetical protein
MTRSVAKLAARGVPETEIAFIQDHDTDAAKDALFKAVRERDVRLLLGSTLKMGEGTNVQQRLVALHHLDARGVPPTSNSGKAAFFARETPTSSSASSAM